MKDKEKKFSTGSLELRCRFSLFPKSLSNTLTEVVKPVYKKHGFAEHRILTEWHLIVGSELAAYSVPQKLVARRGQPEGGTLHVLVASARALELQHLQPMILDKIATYFGYSAVTRLTFVQTTSLLLRKGSKPKQKPKSAPDKALVAVVAQCEDESLRRALQSLGEAIAVVEN